MLENINLAFQGVWSHKLRSFLTMLGIIIGIAAIITIVSTIKGTNEQIKQNLIGAGNNVVNVTLMQDNNQMDFSYASVPQGISMITSEMRDEIDKLDKVQEASLYYSRSWADGVYVGNSSFNGNIYGGDSHFLSVAGYMVNYGRGFIDSDFTTSRKVVLIDANTAQSLFQGQNPIGGTIEIKGEPFVVVGGIGVMNIMLVSVTERTREIGLKIAIGAQQSRILWQFLTEAAVLTSLGGILGVACGIGLAYMLSSIMGTPVAISVGACAVAVAFSMIIGVVFGLMPAVKASKLNPIEALRRE